MAFIKLCFWSITPTALIMSYFWSLTFDKQFLCDRILVKPAAPGGLHLYRHKHLTSPWPLLKMRPPIYTWTLMLPDDVQTNSMACAHNAGILWWGLRHQTEHLLICSCIIMITRDTRGWAWARSGPFHCCVMLGWLQETCQQNNVGRFYNVTCVVAHFHEGCFGDYLFQT